MGRYNNKRTQAAAQAAKNTPSRARFSKGPPNKGRGGKGGRGGRKEREPPPKPKSRGIGGSSSNSNSGRGRGGRNRGNPQTTARVIDKIQNRVGGSNSNEAPATAPPVTLASSSIDIALNNLDKSKLDVVAVSKETQNLIADLLRELGVVGNANGGTKNKNNNISNDTSNETIAQPKGMNPNANEYEYNPASSSFTENGFDTSTASVLEDEEEDENDDYYEDEMEDDDDSVDSDQRMYDFLMEQSDARNTHAAIREEEEEEDYYDDGDENDEMQKRMVANRRKKNREKSSQNYNPNEPEQDESDTINAAIIADDDDADDDTDHCTNNKGSVRVVTDNEGDEEKPETIADATDDLENDRTYLHLTQTLSFSRSQASKACRAIECWDTNIKAPDDSIGDGSNTSKNSESKDPRDSKIMDQNNNDDDNKLELAMDWLCLHLSEAEINRGFRPNPNASKVASSQSNSNNGGLRKLSSAKIKAVAHPSISVISKPIEEQAKEWAKAIELQERTLKLMRLGFHRADAIQAFDDISSDSGSKAVIDDPALLLLLSRLQDASGGESSDATSMNEEEEEESMLETAKEEREQELEALRAIYDDRLKVVYRATKDGSDDGDSNSETGIPERYILQIHPATPLGEPAKADECFLHVFLRDKYPVSETPLLLLTTKPGLPPSLCRKILSNLGQKAQEILGISDGAEMGYPVVFEAVSYLEENLPTLHKEFCNEQRRKEFEAEQARLLRQRQIEMEKAEKAMELLYNKTAGNENKGGGVESASGLGRRQRAKLKAAEKAFDRPEQAKALYKEYRRKQDERVKAAQHQNQSANVRATKAQQAILNRQKELIDGEAEKAARSALNNAFRQGKSKEEAREAAEKARIESYRENGVTIVNEEEEKEETKDAEETEKKGDESAKSDPKAPSQKPRPTEASSKFMERLRNTAGQASAVTIDSSAMSTTETRKKPTKGPTPNTSAFMDRLREMYENAAKNGKNSSRGKNQGGNSKDSSRNKLDGYHLDSPDEEDEEVESNDGNSTDESSNIKRPRPVAVPAGELVEVMTDIITQQENQPWLVSSEARAPTTHNAERKQVTPAQLKREKEISDRLKNELSRKRRMAKEWAESNNGNDDDTGNNTSNKKSKKSGGKGRKKEDTGFTPERFYNMMEVRKRLPAFQLHEELVQTIDRNQITVIAGATGCGKTTQVPQLVLDDLILRGLGAATNMIVTQPRRISAIGVSERIAQERCERVGETCGYSIKLEKKMSAKTRLLLCTTGVLLRRLQCDPDLASISHIFVDEVHERDLNTDFLIIILKDLLARRKDLKLVLMSATLNADSFSKYFGGCPVVSIPGRAHPVEENRLEDILELTGYQVEEGGDYALKTGPNKSPKISKSALRRLYYPKYSKETIHSLSIVDETAINYELLSELLEHISLNQGEGAILVFCPGFQEIQKTIEEMYKKEYFQGSDVVIYPLHSSLSTEEQVAIFEIPPPGVRKIVVSTNIAETSITIEDVVFVVDTGRVKENRRDEVNETPTLEECWVSRASAKQRRGRAGRVRPGIAYHMYSSHTHDDDMLEYQLPEMLRVGIEDLVLQILILDLGEPTSFLKKALDPPSNLALSNSLRLLEELGAVDCRWKNQRNQIFSSTKDKEKEEENLDVSSELTALGFHLATLPVDPRVGKMMIYGALFGCVDPLLTFAAAMSARSPFVSPFDQRDQADEARKTFSVAGSDHLTILNAFNQWSDLRRTEGNRVVNAFLKDNFLGRLTLFQMEDLRKQFHSLLTDIGFLPKKFRLKDMDHASNNNSQNQGLIKAILCAGLYPNIIVAPRNVVGTTAPPKKSDKKVGENAFRSHTKGEVYLHPSTIAFDESKLDSRYCCYHELVRTSKTYVRDCTTVSPFALLLFGGTLEVYQTHGVCSVDGWLKFRIDAKPATLIKYLRGKMERLLFQKIVSPHEDVIESDEGRALIQSISRLFETEHNLQLQNATRTLQDIPDRSGGEIVRPWTGVQGENDRIQAIETERRNNANNHRNREGRGGRGRGGGRRGGRSGRGRGSRR